MLDNVRKFKNMIHNEDKYDTRYDAHLQMQQGNKATWYDQIRQKQLNTQSEI